MLTEAHRQSARLLLMARDVVKMRAAYSPDQPRDEQGRWTDTGASTPAERLDSMPRLADGNISTNAVLGPAVKFHAYPDDGEREVPLGTLDVKIKELISTQPEGVSVRTVRKYLTGPDIPIDVYERDGKRYIADGHHRVIAAIARGDKTIRADVTRIEKIRGAAARYPVRDAADRLAPTFSVALRAAFSVARKKMPDAKAAVKALENALEKVLPALLTRAVREGGQVASLRLTTAEWDESKHLRKPAGSSEGGEFTGGSNSNADLANLDDLTKPERESLFVYQERGIRVRNTLLVFKSKDAAVRDLDKKLEDSGWKKENALSIDEDGSEEHQYSKPGDWLNAYVHPNSKGRTTIIVFDQTAMDTGGKLHNDDVYVPPFVKKLYGLSMRSAARKPLVMKFDGKNPRIAEWAAAHAAELIQGIAEATREWIREATTAHADGDLNDAEYADALREAVGDEARVETIARTETMRSVHQGQREAWAQAVDDGLLDEGAKRVWIVTPDDKLCPICEPLDGEQATLDGLFANEFDGPPAHPNCRCTEGLA